MVVMEPLKVKIVNFHLPATTDINVPDFPNDPQKGFHSVPFGEELYIECSDFKEVRYPSKILLTIFSLILMWTQHCPVWMHVLSPPLSFCEQ
jgi:hypothetical protein